MDERVKRAKEAMEKSERQMTGMMTCLVLNQKSSKGEVYPWTGSHPPLRASK
jgi:hypothetical protein